MQITKGRRYAKRYKHEDSYDRNVKEMIEMIKREKVSHGRIKYRQLRMSKHAIQRATEYFDCSAYGAINEVISLLKRSKRVGEQLAYDGRINVMFVCDQFAIYLSPNLMNVITIHKFNRVTYKPIESMIPELRKQFKDGGFKSELVKLHKKAWEEVEIREMEQQRLVLEIDSEVNKQIANLKNLKRDGFSPRHYKKYISERIKEESARLIAEGEKLFCIKLEKRHIGKSITAVL